ncbi:MAG TPA: DUF1800 domain-containing protein [Thermoanaerobaculia bacterium]|jgi:uncharacterized protein (DUF1800 family)|nr:DUF1800 domain-containing protein [Thermoanaerobaculia bacterium]
MNHATKLVAGVIALAVLTGFTTTDNNKLNDRQRALHVLNRLAFGPRPGDVEAVMKDGVDTWIEQQLHPEAIPDRAVQARVDALPTMTLSNSQILRTYYAPVLEARKEAKAEAKDGEVDKKDVRREMMRDVPANQKPQVVMNELVEQRILRAAESDRQLNEVMVDFWMNHFNVFSGKGIDRFLLTSYERDVIRPHIWGRFEDLLMATAKSPAMLFYLDNARSVAAIENRPMEPQRGGFFGGRFGRYRMMAPPRAQNKQQGGLNENYAREIMELHTLGVDAGYTQKDVTELARVLTGWTITSRRDGGEEGAAFIFRPRLHDVGPKVVMGIRFAPGGGIEEGERMIHVLAHHPATAHHIAYELCRRLVADEPPPALVDRVAKRFLATDGDLRETVRAILKSPEFWDPAVYRAKVKSPFEYTISAVRAVNAQITDPSAIARSLQQIGEPLYGAQPPTGYSDKADVWINTGALMNRLNFALSLAANKLPGVHGDVVSLIPAAQAADASHSVEALALALTGGTLTEETRNTIKSRIVERKAPAEDPWDNTQLPTVAGLILGSPEFQRQ